MCKNVFITEGWESIDCHCHPAVRGHSGGAGGGGTRLWRGWEKWAYIPSFCAVITACTHQRVDGIWGAFKSVLVGHINVGRWHNLRHIPSHHLLTGRWWASAIILRIHPDCRSLSYLSLSLSTSSHLDSAFIITSATDVIHPFTTNATRWCHWTLLYRCGARLLRIGIDQQSISWIELKMILPTGQVTICSDCFLPL